MNISDYTDNLVPFTTNFIQNTTVIWFDQEAIEFSTEELWDSGRFKDEFSYVISEGWLSELSVFDFKKTRTLYAERYGSFGLSGNGGGARCGNFGDFQLKGTGKNPLAGCKDEWHAYGGLSLTEATVELINAQILDKVLPLGTVPCLGLIFTGKDTAYTPYETANYKGNHTVGKGAILVRHACVRPAHFLENPFYKIPEKLRLSVPVDRVRTKRVLQQLIKPFNKESQLICFLAEYVANCANQMAFAKLFRLYHGAFTVNNVAMDGRWLDLTNVSFVISGRNYQNSKTLASFNDEHHCPITVIDEILYNLIKYLGISLDPTPLYKYYYDQYTAYQQIHILTLLGLDVDYEYINEKDDTLLSKVIEDFINIIISGKKPYNDIPNIKDNDDTTKDLITCLIKKIFDYLLNSNSKRNLELDHYEKLFKLAFSSQKNITNLNTFIYKTYIRAIKQAVYVKLFFRGKIIDDIRNHEKDVGDESGARIYTIYIESALKAVDWIFSKTEKEHTTIFKNENVKVSYICKKRKYKIENKLINKNFLFSTGKSVIDYLNKKDINTKINDTDFLSCIDYIIFNKEIN